VAHATTTHQTTIKAETVVMMVVGMTIAVERTTTTTFEMTIAEITAIIAVVAGLIRMATRIIVMAITISAATSGNTIYAIASTKEPTIEHPTKVIAIWNMTLPTACRV